VGVIIQAPFDTAQRYRIRFNNGDEASLSRLQFAIRKQHQREGFQWNDLLPSEIDLSEHVIYRCVVGSRAYGLEQEGSDTDRRGIYLPPAELHWSLGGVPDQLEIESTQECYWELRKFLILALKANPNVLECLYTPLVETATPRAEELLAERGRFLSRLVYQTYNGYVMSQFKKLEQDLRSRGELKWKHAMHLIRLLLSGITVLKEEMVQVGVEAQRERLLQIRAGELPWEQVNEWRLQLHREFDQAYAVTRLPERPDYAWANAFLIRARRSTVAD
jgi:predicted nucleotidyltransferase